ncbi:MAG: hypothetical protein J0L93_06135 [Deltaproteobacteria bacterium]|nr:hypothetical protein [Deltaproteobacteria bacterium]
MSQDLLPQELASRMKEENLRQALFYAWILERVPLIPRFFSQDRPAKILDLGSKNFVYAAALAKFLNEIYENFYLTGLEIDPHRVYRDFYTRGDYAQYYAALASSFYSNSAVRFQEGDWLDEKFNQNYDLITCFFPFLYEDLHSKFGLLPQSFSPEAFYRKAITQAAQILFFHQGQQEYTDSLELLQKLGGGEIVFSENFFANPWMKRKYPVYVLLWRKN